MLLFKFRFYLRLRLKSFVILTYVSMLFSVPTGLEDVSRYVELVSALYASGKWSIEELKKLVGLNFLRVYTEVEKVTYFSLFL